MIADYRVKKEKNLDEEKLIGDIFNGSTNEKAISDILNNIKLDISNNIVNELTAEWVKEWHKKQQKNAGNDPKTAERRNFITSSLESEQKEPELTPVAPGKKDIGRYLKVRYISLSAAAVLGAFILVRTLLPAYNPDKLFNSYYEPVKAISPVTRSAVSIESDSYASAIEMYKIGDYQRAATGFSGIITNDNSAVAPRFFLGVTQVALGNYSEAIDLLSGISGLSGEYMKETRWYLGLAYLKTGEKDKATACFEILAQTPGYYSERAGKILRRLK